MINKYITIVLLVILLIYLFNNTNNNAEHLTTESATSNEALQNLSSAYNTGNATLSNLTLTGALVNTGNTTLSNLGVTGTLTIGDTVLDQTRMKFIPGAYIINDGDVSIGKAFSFFGRAVSKESSRSTYPICSSLPDYSAAFGNKNFGNFYIVLPGYKVIAYKYANYSAGNDLKEFETYDNTTGTIQKIFPCNSTLKNADVSCKLYYKDTLL